MKKKNNIHVKYTRPESLTSRTEKYIHASIIYLCARPLFIFTYIGICIWSYLRTRAASYKVDANVEVGSKLCK